MTPFPSRFFIFFLFAFALIAGAESNPLYGAPSWKTLPSVQTAFGVTNFEWDGDSLCFSNEQKVVRFYQGRRKSDVNGTTVWLNAPPYGSVTSGGWRLASTDLDLLLLSMLPKEEGTPKPLRVMLDPGHGGEDDGASSKKPAVREKELVLAIALRIGEHLARSGMTVFYTRTNDIALALNERSALARQNKADLFISIHANFASNSDAAGAETYALTPSGYSGTTEGSRIRGWQVGNRNDYHNTLLGFSIHSKLATLPQTFDRGLKRQSFSVLRETSCPAVLLEIGFLSNHADTLKMLNTNWQEKCAAVVTEGVSSYAKKVDALDRAVAERRAREAEANERWRLRLAAQEAAKSSTSNAPASSNKTAVVHADAVAHAFPLPHPPASTATVHTVSAPSSFSTNMSPLALGTLIDFYATGKTE